MRLTVCGDFNVNFNDDTPHRRSLISLLATFGLYGTVEFHTRIHNKSITTIDNIFVNSIKQKRINVYPWINGLSDHDAQFIILHDIKIRTAKQKFYTFRNFNKTAVTNFNLQLSYESWEEVLLCNDVNSSFNKYLNTYLGIFYASFPIRIIQKSSSAKPCLMQGIKIFCMNKRKLYLIIRQSKDHNKKTYYKDTVRY